MSHTYENYQELLETTPNVTQRTSYAYYRKIYANPVVGDIITLKYYNHDFDTISMVITVVKDGLYTVVPVRQHINKSYTNSAVLTAPTTRDELYIPEDAHEGCLDMKTLRKDPNFLSMNIYDLWPFPPSTGGVDDMTIKLLRKSSYSITERLEAFTLIYKVYLKRCASFHTISLPQHIFFPLLFTMVRGERFYDANLYIEIIDEMARSASVGDIHIGEFSKEIGYAMVRALGISVYNESITRALDVLVSMAISIDDVEFARRYLLA